MFVGASRVVVAAVAAPSRRLPSLLAAAGEPEPIVSPLVGGLAYLGGWNDVNTFRRFGCYSNMMTGNSISFGWALGAMQWADTAFFLAVVSSYVLGVCSYRAAATWQPRRHRASRAAAAAVALAFVAADCLASCRWAVVPLALGSGIVNAVSSDEAGTVTCMVTGHLGKIANTLVDGLAGGLGAAPRRAGLKSVGVLAAFLCGVVCNVRLLSWISAATPPLRLAAAWRMLGLWLPTFSAVGASYAAVLLLGQGEVRADP